MAHNYALEEISQLAAVMQRINFSMKDGFSKLESELISVQKTLQTVTLDIGC